LEEEKKELMNEQGYKEKAKLVEPPKVNESEFHRKGWRVKSYSSNSSPLR
jgi:hypothetical protein